VLALLVGACGGAGNDGGTGTPAMTPFGSNPGSQNPQQQNGAPNAPGQTPGGTGDPTAPGAATSETTPGGIALAPGSDMTGANPTPPTPRPRLRA